MYIYDEFNRFKMFNITDFQLTLCIKTLHYNINYRIFWHNQDEVKSKMVVTLY